MFSRAFASIGDTSALYPCHLVHGYVLMHHGLQVSYSLPALTTSGDVGERGSQGAPHLTSPHLTHTSKARATNRQEHRRDITWT